MGEKVVIITGAGATLADCIQLAGAKRPPLDRGFFNAVVQRDPELVTVAQYFRKHYQVELTSPSVNSLEYVMAILYTDAFGGALQDEASKALRQLIKVFLKRLATTTNPIRMGAGTGLYRLLCQYLDRQRGWEDLTIITFNQDLQIEKALLNLATAGIRRTQPIFRFPACYRITFDQTTRPINRREGQEFLTANDEQQGVAVLKLHGSMNWYSAHNSPNPSQRQFLNPTRSIRITTRKTIDPSMTLDQRVATRARFTFPVIVPPVVHKSQILHERLKPLWELAEARLSEADRVVIFGYSCPVSDWESANLISRALVANKRQSEVSIVNPEPAVMMRFQSLGNLQSMNYYTSIRRYLRAD